MKFASTHHARVPRSWIAVAAVALLAVAWCSAGSVSDGIQGAAAKMAPSDRELNQMQTAQANADAAATGNASRAIALPADARDLAGDSQSLEIGEIGTPRDLLRDDERIRRLLREEAEFRYDPQGRPDPMVAPWIRARVMARELNDIAEKAVAANDLERAKKAYSMVRLLEGRLKEAGFGVNTIQEFLQKAVTGLSQLQAIEETQAAAAGQEAPKAKLPLWVRNHTTGIIYDTVEPVCLVGPHTLREGELVPGQPVEVTVAKINPASVVYRVRDITFEVGVEEGE